MCLGVLPPRLTFSLFRALGKELGKRKVPRAHIVRPGTVMLCAAVKMQIV